MRKSSPFTILFGLAAWSSVWARFFRRNEPFRGDSPRSCSIERVMSVRTVLL